MDLRYIIKSLKIEMDRKKDAGENFSILETVINSV